MTNSTLLVERQQFRLQHLLHCETSGTATIDYAREHNLYPRNMYSTRQDLVHKGALPADGKPRFALARVAAVVAARWHVQLPNDASVSFDAAVYRDNLARILQTAAVLPWCARPTALPRSICAGRWGTCPTKTDANILCGGCI